MIPYKIVSRMTTSPNSTGRYPMAWISLSTIVPSNKKRFFSIHGCVQKTSSKSWIKKTTGPSQMIFFQRHLSHHPPCNPFTLMRHFQYSRNSWMMPPESFWLPQVRRMYAGILSIPRQNQTYIPRHPSDKHRGTLNRKCILWTESFSLRTCNPTA